MLHDFESRRTVMKLCIFILLFLLSCEQQDMRLPFYTESTLTPKWISPESKEYASIHRIGQFELIDQSGKTINQESMKNKLLIVDFFFTSCPGICKDLAKNMRLLQTEFNSDDQVQLMSITATPIMDSIPVLNAYAKRNNVQHKKWKLLTGDRDHIYDLARHQFFAEMFTSDVMDNEFIHTENMLLIDTFGRIRGVYNGTLEFDMRRLIEDVTILQKES